MRLSVAPPRLLLLMVALAAFLAACTESGASDGTVGPGATSIGSDFKKDDGKLKVATTVAPLSSIVLNVGGSRVHVRGLIPDGVNSHTYEPRPSDAEVLSRADMLIMNGAHLEGTVEAIAKANLKDPTKIYRLADNTLSGDDPMTGFLYDFSFPKEGGVPNPHLWMDPLYALKYADLIRQWLSENDPEDAAYYRANYEKFAAVLRQLDEAIRKDQQSVPVADRKLLTYHDSWAYWARRYGWTVIGAVQPSDFSEPSAKDVADLITQIKRERVPAVFGSEVFPSKTLETIAKEGGATFEDQLSDDAPPGKPQEARHTYLGMMVEDMKILFTRLGGAAGEVLKVPVANTATDERP